MAPKGPSRPGRQQLAQAGPLRGPLRRFCTASKTLLDAAESGKGALDDSYIDGITDTLRELGATVGSLDDEGRAALFVALHNSITAALRWPASSTVVELRAGYAVRKLCAIAALCARDLVGFDDNGAFLRSQRHRDDAVAFASALLESNALESFAQRLSEASAAALDVLLRYQRSQQQGQQHEDRPMGLAQQQQGQVASDAAPLGRRQDTQRQGTTANTRGDGGHSSSSSACGSEDICSLQDADAVRLRMEQWLPILQELGALVYVIAQHDPYGPTPRHQPSSSTAGFGAPAPVGPLERGRPPPIQPTFASVLASSGIFEHAARAMVTVALLSGTTSPQGLGSDSGEQAESSSRQGAGGGRAAAGAGAGGGGGGAAGGRRYWETFANSSLAIESCASLLQRVGLTPEVASTEPATGGSSGGSSVGVGGRGDSSKGSNSGGGRESRGSSGGSKAGHDPATRLGEQQQPHSFGPWSRYVLMGLGLRCLRGLDGGSCYGMPRELVRGMPELVAPGTLVYDRDTRELGRLAMAPVQMVASRIQVLRALMGVLEPVGYTARLYGTEARGTEVYGSSAAGPLSTAKAGAGAAGKGFSAATSGRPQAAGDVGAGEGRWPAVGPKAARDISRRVVVWAMALARGWAEEEEQRQRAGGGGGRGAGLKPWGTMRMGGPAGSQQDNDDRVLAMAKCMMGPLTVQALGVFRRTLGDGGLAAEQQGEQQALDRREAGAGRGGVGGSTGHGRQWLGQEEGREERKQEQQQEQQQVLLAEWYGMACGVVRYSLRWVTGDNTGCDLGELMALGLPQLTRTDPLPPLPPPFLAAALSGGYLPCLDTLLRRCGRGLGHGDMLLMSHLVLHRRILKNLVRIYSAVNGTRSDISGNNSGSVSEYAHDLPWLLAYGNPRQSASLLASMAKMVRRAAGMQQEGRGDAVWGWGDTGFAALGLAARGSDEDMVAYGLASMLCNNLGAAFDWMQEQAALQPFSSSAARAGAPSASCASTTRADGASAAGRGGGDEPEAGDAAVGYPAGAQRLRLLLSFALAKVVPPLSSHLILQCSQLTMHAAGSGGRGDGYVGVCADEVRRLADDLSHLLSVLLAAQKIVWRCRDVVGKGEGAGPGSGGGGGSRASNAPVAGAAPGPVSGGGSASAAGQHREGPTAAGPGAAAAADLGALADGLQGLLDGDADMAGLVGAAMDCLQLLPASDGGQLAARVLELTHCALWSCQYDMGTMRLPDGSPFLSFSASSPAVQKVLWGASSSAERLRAAVTLARFAGYAAEAKHGDVLVMIASRYSPGCEPRVAPEVPVWLLVPSEAVRELGGSCCCNTRCTRLEGDSEAGKGQGQGLLVCGRFWGAWYCCRECQVVDWAAGHKAVCRWK